MAQRVTIELLDDVNGAPADETVSFSLDGVDYEIDLTSDNSAQLREALSTWITSARRTGGRRTTKKPANKATNTTAIRTWAKEQGLEVSDRGRIPNDIAEAYAKAH